VKAGQSGAVDERSAVGVEPVPLKVFINYRHEDADAAALLLYDRLAPRFGAANIFLDFKTLELGTHWLEEIKAQGYGASVFLALIGRTWLGCLKDRQQAATGEPEDFVTLELENALRRWPGKIIPVLVGATTMPGDVQLPKPIRALAGYQGVPLRIPSFDEDLKVLIAELDALGGGPVADAAGAQGAEREQDGETAPDTGTRFKRDSDAASQPPPGSAVPVQPGGSPDTGVAPERHGGIDGELQGLAGEARRTGHHVRRDPAERSIVQPPDSDHYETVLECMIEEGRVVPVLGTRVRGSLPDAEQLASYLAETFKLSTESRDLAEVAQHVAMAKGPGSLHRAMRDALRLEPEPTDAHRFLARFPKRLEQLGLPARYQMIVTSSYDSALERAFDAESEPYDLAVFMASGEDEGKFIHEPWKGEPEVISDTRSYKKFPIDPGDELEHTVIVKISGAIQPREGDRLGGGNYVLTEDQYIDYLVTDQIIGVIPNQILNKLQSSHRLFLGYALRDWSLRVFLKRVWEGKPLEDKSWAIECEPAPLEKEFWSSLNVELLAAQADDYANELDARMEEWRAEHT